MSSLQDSPSISVVIPSYRRLARLPGLVAEYSAQRADEIIVVLDGPHPGWHEYLGAAVMDGVRVIELPVNRGRSLARLAGLEAATSAVVLETDDDVVPAAGLVERHREFHRAGTGRVLLGYMPVALPPRRSSDEAPTFLYARDYAAQARVWRTGSSDDILSSLWGGNVSFDRALYVRAEQSRPRERLDYNEDLDLGLRLVGLGAVAGFDELARADHHHERNLDGFVRECATRGEAIAILEKRWGERPAQLTPLVTIPAGYNPVLGWVQRRIAAHDSGGLVQSGVVAAYRLAGITRRWALQDASARLLRRALVMRGYRMAGVRRRAA